MLANTFFDTVWFTYVLLPALIFLSRIVDVTLDTLRIVFISKGNKVIAPILGFFEVLIWLIAISEIMQNLDNVTCYIAYAAGFAAGNFIGLKIESRLAIGVQIIRIITHKDSSELINELREAGMRVTSMDAEGKEGKVHIVYSVVERSKINAVIGLINLYNPKAFYSIEDVRSINPKSDMYHSIRKKGTIRWFKKGR
jgi:uncharacterized protein YebE (UPF0316 family)